MFQPQGLALLRALGVRNVSHSPSKCTLSLKCCTHLVVCFQRDVHGIVWWVHGVFSSKAILVAGCTRGSVQVTCYYCLESATRYE